MKNLVFIFMVFASSIINAQTIGEFTDTRDGKTYKTVKIGNQVWMAENLAYLPIVCSGDETCGFWVYDYWSSVVFDAKNTDNYKTYGVLYSQKVAKNVCPAGWHLPSEEEWNELVTYVETEQNCSGCAYEYLKSKNYWLDRYKGNDYYNFNALPAGFLVGKYTIATSYNAQTNKSTYQSYDAEFKGLRTSTIWNSSSGYFSFESFQIKLEAIMGGAVCGYSVRCIKD